MAEESGKKEAELQQKLVGNKHSLLIIIIQILQTITFYYL